MRKIIALFFCLFMFANAAGAVTIETTSTWYRLHLGMGSGENAISLEDVNQFIDTVISPRFPVGMTITEARGQWYSPEYGVTPERSIVIDILEVDSEEVRAKIEEIAELYVGTFSPSVTAMFIVRVPNIQTSLYYYVSE